MERTHGSTLAVFVTALVLLSSGCSAMKMKPVSFAYYLHDDYVPPDTTSVQVASSNGTLTGTFQFGDIAVFDSPLREGTANDSTLFGYGSGELVSLKQPYMRFITFVHDVTVPGYSGTLSCSGRFNFSAPSWEVGVNSGTGSFRGASGYYTVSIAVPNTAGYVLKYEANLMLPKH
ncbi:protein MpDIR50 [Marchantia polymorpha subsp. ruderalis]|uniref:Dirigent protein n=2 Tax=Marchantia polymorpha TaxID=3197 RepID=A0AAF6BR28_MARPO|nr:hypothetical protein MARPO_0135s0042 [Marchantia polymorpha]BBN14462.1 hypothetical protein Mp_6g11940 [Marchantia polymorpha subsp. ruderalis]|eukprot:PTQ29762.1 hypothetical protein MARPO_0135s0042 [Marchantia polymorpha]